MPHPNKRKQQISILPRKQGRYTLQEMIQVEMIDEEMPQVEITQDELLQEDKIMQKTTIMQKKIVELRNKRPSYTRMSRTIAWRKKQKANTLLNVETSPDLLHLFSAVDIIKRLRLLQPPLAMLLANTLSLVS
ncbi:14035_t:CDS:1 [Racocetra fulgida]|uniref:14035_t:CDS:1 n=1 Tax=Racocetra fulgida TaxID=60492 RepID=A0A9N9CZH4_9GLOM|nr:14035_t:CDS:1 [Racocetra fulgida]